MGNKQSCCFGFKRATNHDKTVGRKYEPGDSGAMTTALTHSASMQQVPHISDREPEDTEGDPSNHPSTNPMFTERSKADLKRTASLKRRKSMYDNMNAAGASGGGGDNKGAVVHKKYSSCSTIYLDDSTVSQPNLKNTIKAVALAEFYHIKNRECSERTLDIFEEHLHPLSKDPVPEDGRTRDPEHRQIYRFIRTLFSAAQLTAECAIVTLVYLERLVVYAELDLMPSNWRRITLGAILLASKVWDDQAVWNVDYCQILKDITVQDMNELERIFLEMLQFNINVPSSVYAKYYFDLRSLADASDLALPLEPLSREKALKLEAMSSVCEDKIKEKSRHRLKRSNSLDGLLVRPRASRAVLS